MMLAIDLVRLFTGVAVLSFSAFTDLKWRRAPNVLWLTMGGVGVVLLALEWFLDADAFLARRGYLAFSAVFLLLVYVFYRIGLIWGGADAKALMALAVLLPFPLVLAPGVPLLAGVTSANGIGPPGFLDVLADSLLAFIVLPFALLALNALRGDFGLPAFLGTKRAVGALGEGYVWPMERVEDDKLVRVWFPTRSPDDLDEQKEKLAALGVTRVWVTPKVPFLVPLLGGLVLAFTVGDVLLAAVRLAVTR